MQIKYCDLTCRLTAEYKHWWNREPLKRANLVRFAALVEINIARVLHQRVYSTTSHVFMNEDVPWMMQSMKSTVTSGSIQNSHECDA